MSSRQNSLKNNTENSANTTTPIDNNIQNISTDNKEKSINLNEFLDFLNLSCHVNDMISQNSEEQQGPYKENSSCNKFVVGTTSLAGGNRSKASAIQRPIDFQKLSQNRLVNDLYGFNQNRSFVVDDVNENRTINGAECSRSIRRTPTAANITLGGATTTISTLKSKVSRNNEGGLHPKLNEKLDYVLNEGILDAVLPFICPIPLPANYTSRLKLKQPRETKDSKSNNSSTAMALNLELTNEMEENVNVNKDANSNKVKSKINGVQPKSKNLMNASKKE